MPGVEARPEHGGGDKRLGVPGPGWLLADLTGSQDDRSRLPSDDGSSSRQVSIQCRLPGRINSTHERN